jgi:hypothetical protein
MGRSAGGVCLLLAIRPAWCTAALQLACQHVVALGGLEEPRNEEGRVGSGCLLPTRQWSGQRRQRPASGAPTVGRDPLEVASDRWREHAPSLTTAWRWLLPFVLVWWKLGLKTLELGHKLSGDVWASAGPRLGPRPGGPSRSSAFGRVQPSSWWKNKSSRQQVAVGSY